MATTFVAQADFPATRSETGITTTTVTVDENVAKLHARASVDFDWSVGTSGVDVPAVADTWTLVYERAGNKDKRTYTVDFTLASSGDLYLMAVGQ